MSRKHTLEHLTLKQAEIVQILVKGNGLDEASGNIIPCDLDQLRVRLSYVPSKASLQFSIRALMNRKLIIKGDRVPRRGRKRAILFATDLAKNMVRGHHSSTSIVEHESEIDMEVDTNVTM